MCENNFKHFLVLNQHYAPIPDTSSGLHGKTRMCVLHNCVARQIRTGSFRLVLSVFLSHFALEQMWLYSAVFFFGFTRLVPHCAISECVYWALVLDWSLVLWVHQALARLSECVYLWWAETFILRSYWCFPRFLWDSPGLCRVVR
jgi:hypothetical protein